MKHAFLIIAHNEWPLLKLLLSMLDDSRNDLYLHIDRRAEGLREQVERYRPEQSRLFLHPCPIKTRWGNYSQVETELLLFEQAYRNGPYLYYHLLSGTDLPLKPPSYIHHFFELHQGQEFLGFFQGAQHEADIRKKMSLFYLLNHHKKEKKGIVHPVCSMARNVMIGSQKAVRFRRSLHFECKKGSNWVSITHDACAYLLSQKDSKMLKRFRYTLCPDELFLHTLLWNSPFRERIFDTSDLQRGSMRKIDWERGKPYTWQEQDLEELLASDLLFARTFTSKRMKLALTLRHRVIPAG